MRWLVLVSALLACGCSRSRSEGESGAAAPPPQPSPASGGGSGVPASNAGSAKRATDPVAQLPSPAGPGAFAANPRRVGDDLVMTWVEPAAGDGDGHRVRMSRRPLGDGSWATPITIAEGPDVVANWADFPSVQATQDGALIAHWLKRRGEGHSYDVALSRSTDGGATWRPLGLAHHDGTASEHGFVSLLPADGGVTGFWLDGRHTAGHGHGGGGGAMTLRTAAIASRADDGRALDDRVCDCCATDAAHTDRGAVVVYRDRGPDEQRDIAIVRQTEGGWTPPTLVHADHWRIRGCPVNGPAVAARGSQVAVAWFTAARGQPRVQVAVSTDAGATFGAPVVVDAPRDRTAPLGRVDIELDAHGAIVTWMAADRDAAAVWMRRVSVDGRVGDAVSVATTSADRDAGFPRLVLANGRAIVAWTDTTGDASAVRLAALPTSALPRAKAAPEPPRPAALRASVGDPAPAYAAADLDGAGVSLAGLRGSPVLLNVWATWCEACRHELPTLARLFEGHRERGLRVVAVSIDERSARNRVVQFARRRRLPFDVWLDPDDRASRLFGIGALPASFLFDASGTLVWQRAGVVEDDDPELSRALQRVLPR